ncbi:hypothetical protein ACJX0J_017914, partial [Zea mays]
MGDKNIKELVRWFILHLLKPVVNKQRTQSFGYLCTSSILSSCDNDIHSEVDIFMFS